MSVQTVIRFWLVCQMRPIRAQLGQPYLICLIYKHPVVPVRSLAFPYPPHSTLGPAEQRHWPVSLLATSTTAPSLMRTSTLEACSSESRANPPTVGWRCCRECRSSRLVFAIANVHMRSLLRGSADLLCKHC
jgi:hypothetical protein